MKIITGIYQPETGNIILDGELSKLKIFMRRLNEKLI
jgi:ABC-type sugar transport system ATPase subunit